MTIALVASSVAAHAAPEQGPTDDQRSVVATRLAPDSRILLDGRLDEQVWELIPPITSFVQQEPVEGAVPSERTEVRIAHDGSALYIGVIAFDSDPDGILAYQRRRDAGLDTDDRFMWIIDPFGDGRTAYFFEINPAGLKGDGLLRTGQGGGLNKSWDGIWDVQTARRSDGWSAEIRIPFRTLNFDPDQDEWGINFQRTVRRKNEELVWSGYRRNQGLLRPQHAGRLTGMRGMSQGLGLELKPYAVATAEGTPARNAAAADAGFDVSYSVTSNLRASVSVNTDFAEVEVDQRRINLTRFPISFPEQRDFFLEGANVFSFASASGVSPFFSRRVGLIGGTPVPILFGGRISGQVAGTDVGLFQVRTRSDGPFPAEDFTGARIRRNILSASTAGLLYTRRATHGGPEQPFVPDRHSLGADVDLETSRFLGDQNAEFQSFWVWTSPVVLGDTTSFLERSAYGVRLSLPNNPWSGHVSYRILGSAYDPAVGFVGRRGFQRLQPTITYAPFVEGSSLIRQVSWQARYEHLTDMQLRPLTTVAAVTPLDIRFETGDRVTAEVWRGYEWLLEPFRLLGRDDLLIPEGTYRSWGAGAAVRSASHRPVAGSVEYSRDGFWTGTRDRFDTSVTLRPLPGVALTGFYSLNRIELADGGVDTHLLIAASSFDLTTSTSISANAQFDNLSDTIGLFGRLRWIVRPGSDLYVVYTHNWLTADGSLATLERSGATKLTYTHWF
jgi:hypothetical protein